MADGPDPAVGHGLIESRYLTMTPTAKAHNKLQTKIEHPDLEITVTLPIEPCELRHGFRMDLQIRHDDACVLHGIRQAMENRGERLKSGEGRLVNSNADTVRRIIEIIADQYRSDRIANK